MNTLVINMSINKNSSQITRLITLLLENAQSKHPQKTYHFGHMEEMIVLSTTKNTLIFNSLVQTYNYCTGKKKKKILIILL